MLEPFEYEKTRSDVSIRESKVQDGSLDTSLLDSQLENLNNFSKISENEKFLRDQAPFTKSFQEEFGRVTNDNVHKSHFQSEAIAQLGSITSEYDINEFRNLKSRDNASVLISNYLDKEVGFVPGMLSTVNPVEKIKIDDPIMSPGISFIDSRKNMATHF